MFKGNSPAVQQSNSSPGPTSPPRERRPLRSVPAIGPHYKVDPEVLAKEYVEKECKVCLIDIFLTTSSKINHFYAFLSFL